MATQLSAGVQITETDLSTRAAAVATSIGAYVGASTWGEPFERTLVTYEDEFKAMFGKPNDTTYQHFFTVAGFLKFANSMTFVRAVDTTTALNSALSATVSGSLNIAGAYIKSKDWESYTPPFSPDDCIYFYAKYPSADGNNIKIGLVNYSDWSTHTTTTSAADCSAFYSYVEYGPTTTDEVVIFVEALNELGDYEIVEQYLVSRTKGTLDAFGNTMYVDNLINNSSSYIMAFNNTLVTSEVPSLGATSLTNGAYGYPSAGNIMTGYDLFNNPEQIEINYLIGGANTSIVDGLPQYISSIAVSRADCISLHDPAFLLSGGDTSTLSPSKTDSDNTTALINYRNNISATSYSAFYGNWLYIYDKYNDKNRWVPSTGYVAGIYALTAERNDAWFAPAGLNRGILNNVIKIAYNPNKAYRDKLYTNQINPIVNFPGQGIVIWGQKTLQTRPSAFDRVNVRLLFLYMEKVIGNASKYVVFEQNDSLTRAVFMNMVKPFMEDIKGRRGVTDYLIDIGDKVNTPEVIDNNEFRANIYVKPTRAAEFIRLNFIATKTGVDFSELTA